MSGGTVIHNHQMNYFCVCKLYEYILTVSLKLPKIASVNVTSDTLHFAIHATLHNPPTIHI